jgi:thioredoxin 1
MSSTIVTGTTSNWKQEVEQSELPVLVDFWAAWCGPCRMVSPVIDALGEKHSGKIKVVKVNVDENQELAEKYGVMSIPTIMLFNKGKLVDAQIGAAPSNVFEELLKSNNILL